MMLLPKISRVYTIGPISVITQQGGFHTSLSAAQLLHRQPNPCGSGPRTLRSSARPSWSHPDTKGAQKNPSFSVGKYVPGPFWLMYIFMLLGFIMFYIDHCRSSLFCSLPPSNRCPCSYSGCWFCCHGTFPWHLPTAERMYAMADGALCATGPGNHPLVWG